MPHASVLRVFQLDGLRIQQELMKMLVAQAAGACDLMRINYGYRYQDEVDLVLNTVAYWLSVWPRSQSFGDKLQNVVYRDEALADAARRAHIPFASRNTVPSKQLKLLHALLTVLLPYAFRKLQAKIYDEGWADAGNAAQADVHGVGPRRLFGGVVSITPEWQRRVAWLVDKSDSAVTAATLLNFIVFLVNGRYRTVVDRLLRLRLVYGRQRMVRQVNLFYLNQRVFWSVLLGFTSVVLPLLNLGRVWGAISRFRTSHSAQPTEASGTACCFCRTPAVAIALPRVLQPCRHTACAYCVGARQAASASPECGACGTVIASVHTA